MAYPDSILLEMQFAGTAGAWTDVTQDVVRQNTITCNYGIQGNSPLDRTASTGTFSFTLNNSASNSAGLVGYYSPGHTNCRVGFKVGITARFAVIYDGETYPKFYGRIPAQGIKLVPGLYNTRQTLVEVRDFMELCAIHDIETPSFAENKTSAEVQALVLANQDIPPLETEYNTCEETFNTVFDTTKSMTKSITEMNKANLAELGYSYVKHAPGSYEIFTVEGRMTRTNTPSTMVVPMPTSSCDYLLLEDGGKITKEDDSGFLKLEGVLPISFTDDQIEGDIQNGNNLYNYIQGISYPRDVGTVAEVLFKSNQAFSVSAGETITLKGTYSDPDNQAARVSAKAMLPIGTADYWLNTARDGSGTALSMTVGSVDFGTNEVIYGQITNNSASNGYGYVQAQGTAIRIYDPVISFVQDTTSIQTHGKHTLNLDMKYQDDPTTSTAFIATMLNQYKDPVTRGESLKFCANVSPERMAAFLNMDIGKRFTIAESVTGINGDYFINGVNFEIFPNNVIFYTWNIKSASFDTFAFWYLETAGMSELSETTFVGF